MTFTASESSTDDLLRQVFEALIVSQDRPTPTKGANREIRGVMLELTNPLARLSRSETRGRLFSCLAEFCWYLSGSESIKPIEFYISHYGNFAESNGIVHGAYGPRLLSFDGIDQIRYVIETLTKRPDSRQAVIQVFDHEDVRQPYEHVPCTLMLQYFIRSSALDAVTFMRSNDAYLGLPHDLFSFTMLQEVIARSLGVEVGRYVHMVGSLHLYERDVTRAQSFLDEGWQSSLEMPPMPDGDPWTSLGKLVVTEEALREGVDPTQIEWDENPYWRDLATLFAIFARKVHGQSSEIPRLREKLSSAVYDVYVNDRYGLVQ